MTVLLKYFYDYYDAGSGRRKFLYTLQRWIVCNRWVARALFGVKLKRSQPGDTYFNLTTLLLKWEMRRQIYRSMYPRLLEIGVGRFAILSGCLSRLVRQRVVACDFDDESVHSALAHVNENGLNVEIVKSDVLGSIPVNEYDLIYWNLPDYDDPAPFLARLLSNAPNYMAASARITIGFNATPLPAEVVLNVVSQFGDLEVERHRRYWWNRHGILTIRLAPHVRRLREQAPHL